MHQKTDYTEPRQIAWEKWRDPYGSDIMDHEWPGALGTFKSDHIVQNVLNGSNQYIDEDVDEDDIQDAIVHDQKEKAVNARKNSIQIISTPLGFFPLTEHNRAGNVFNFWTAHTNFPITQNIIDIINNTEGVETFEVFTQYRWKIAIGKIFNSQEVKDRLTKNLNAVPQIKTDA